MDIYFKRGGIFGVLFAISLFWIIFREKSLFTKKDKNESNDEEKEKEIEDALTQIEAMNENLENMHKKVTDLWEWHSVKDPDGIPIWYVRRTFEESINRLEDSVSLLKEQLQVSLFRLNDSLDANDNATNRLQKVNEERISELKSLLETYNKTITDLSIALEKIKFMLKSTNQI